MKILKVRIWDKLNKRMIYDFQDTRDWEMRWDRERYSESMLYTTLKDRNNKEIYEGDIVSYYDSTKVWLTSFIKEIGGVFAIITKENPILLYEFIGNYEYNGCNIWELEIIGNIYENKELLK